MRRIVTWTAITLALAAGCGKDDGPSGPGGGGGSSAMSATIDGSSWASAATPGAAHAVRGGAFIAVAGSSQSLRVVAFTIPNVMEPGTHELVPPLNAQVQDNIGDAMWMTGTSGATGTVTVTSISAERITGTFSFTATAVPGTAATGTLVVTNGKFDVRFVTAGAAVVGSDVAH